ncbi:unnamed protein product, partial [Rotaria magnacalcarata]
LPDKVETLSRETRTMVSVGFLIRSWPIPGLVKATYERKFSDGTHGSIPLLVKADRRGVLA